MSISSSISRFAVYCKRNGLRATLSRVGLAARRSLFSSRSVLFYCDLSTLSSPAADMPSSLRVERQTNQTDLNPATCKRSPVSGILTWPAEISKSALS